jgi:ABC-type branched-subunit amino acid transport system substrate-binding protein
MAESGSVAAELMRAYFEELNQQGGIYGRKIQIDIVQTKKTPAETAAALEQFARSHDVFAIAGLLAPDAERTVADALENAGVPVVDIFAAEGPERLLAKARVFHLLPGLSPQARALVRFAHGRLDGSASSVAIIAPAERRELARTVEEECRLHAWPAETLNYARFNGEEIAARLSARRTSVVIFLGQGQELHSLLAAGEEFDWRPQIFQPGILAGDEVFRVPPEASERVFFSFATLPSDIAPEALAEYKFLVNKYKLKVLHPARALSALAAAKLFTEGLRQSGRELTREGFVDALAALYNFNTGLTPPLTYGATRRIGALGAYIVRLNTKDNRLVPAAAWIEAGR